MSCTIGALPFLLIFSIVSEVSNTAEAVKNKRNQSEAVRQRIKEQIQQTISDNQGEVTDEQIEQLCREYDTVFMDESVLVKTLYEYGLMDFSKNNGQISARVENFNLIFHREDTSQPYKLNVYSATSCDETMIINDLNSEYALNVQEETYIKIKERLAKKKLQIDEEEVLEDDSIMLTVNLD